MTFCVVTYRDNGEAQLGVLLADGGGLLAPPELKQWATMLELLENWPQASEVLATLPLHDAPPVESADLLTPIRWPRKVLCAGVNYRKHIKEMGGEVPGDGWIPFFFLKPPSTALTGPADPILIRDQERARFDWEAELAVVIGVGGRDIPVRREPFRFDWLAAKAGDTSLPLGPGITPAFCVPDPQDLRLRLWVNGELQQDESTADMICGVDELVAAASRFVTLEPGDVIATGTPSGVGAGRGLYLKHGDVVTVAIDGLGQISNRVIDAERSE